MVGLLHEKIVDASRKAHPADLIVGKDLTRVTHKPQPRRTPDLFKGEDTAIEALTFINGARLDKFGYAYRNLIAVIPIPSNVTDIWIYDELADTIVEKFHRDMDKVKSPRVPLKCFRCDYEWTPRTSRMPKMCPQCKRRDWNLRPSHSYSGERLKQERIRKLLQKNSRRDNDKRDKPGNNQDQAG